jgi:hypothetical protein
MPSYDLKKYAGEHFLKPDDVRDGPLHLKIAVVREGKFDKLDLIFESGDALSLNATNTQRLIRAYGADSKNLIDKEVELFLGTINYNGTDNEAVLVNPITPKDKDVPAPKPTAPTDKIKLDDEIPF